MPREIERSAPGLAPPSGEQVARWAEALEGASAETVLDWTFEHLGRSRVGMTSAFGPEGCALVELVRRRRPEVPVYTIDTGLLFPESVAVREAFRARGVNVVVVEPLVSLGRQAKLHGPDLHDRDPDRCCELRKVEPMRRVLERMDVWITAVRRDQAPTRADTPVVGLAHRADGTPVVKIAPLVRWTRKDTWSFLLAEKLPYNALLDAGYTSVGCQPCTAPAATGGDERDGRWRGRAKTECGIHNL